MGFTSTSVMLCMGTAFSSSGGKLTEHPVTFTLSASDWRALEKVRDSIQKMRHHLESHNDVNEEVFRILSIVNNNATTMAMYLSRDASAASKIHNLLKPEKAENYVAVGLEYLDDIVQDIVHANYMKNIDSSVRGLIDLSRSRRLNR